MEHVAIDLGGRESYIWVCGADGKLSSTDDTQTAQLGEYLKLRGPSRVVMETCAESFAVAIAAKAAGHEVRVVPATLVRALGVGQRRLKTDRRDAQALCEASCRIDLPSVHIRSQQARDRKTLCGMRDALVQARTKLVNTVRGWLRMELVKIKSGDVESFPKRLRETVLSRAEGMPEFVERQLQAIEGLTTQITAATKEIAGVAERDETAQRLMSIPGVGPVTAVRFVATLDEPGRFTDAHRVESYLGLVPSEMSSSEKQRRGSITKAGNGAMRWLLVQAAWSLWRTQPHDPMVQWARKVGERRGRGVAIVALARKLGGIMFAMWRDGTRYSPKLAVRSTPPAEV